MLTKREEYIKTFFIPLQKKEGVQYMSESEAEKVVKKISDIGNNLGFVGQNVSQDNSKNEKRKHKYDVWIAKEAKKDIDILSRIIDLRLIIDWAVSSKADLFAYSFQEAFIEQAKWHQEMLLQYDIEDLKIPNLDPNRVVFRFSDKKHFLYLLTPDDLKFEGQSMGHCVGGQNYKSKVKGKISLIISLRDQNNEPHVTIEIDIPSSQVVQQYGKGNREPVQKYQKLLKEFVLYASNFKGIENPDTLKFLNMHFLEQK
jgi:hypothetical protein